MNKLNLLEEISEQGYEVYLETTYSVDPAFFEQMALRHLLAGGCRYIGLFPDGRCFADSLAHHPSVHELGRSYSVQPIFEPQVFHPKVILMAGPQQAKVMVGSFNLTPAGFVTNREAGNVFRFDSGSGDDRFLGLVQSVVRYFMALSRENPSDSMRTLFAKLLQFSYLAETKAEDPSGGPVFLDNLTSPLADQLSSLIDHKVQHIEVMAPYFDRGLSMADDWMKRYEPESIVCWLQKGTTNFPVDSPLAEQIQLLGLYFNDKESRQPRFHGKVFRLKGEGRETVIYGSANFSRQAWLLPANKGGNAEAVIVESGPAGAFDAFFENEVTGMPLELSEVSVFEEDEEDEQPRQTAFVTDSLLDGEELRLVLSASAEIEEVRLDSAHGEILTGTAPYAVLFKGIARSLSTVFELTVRFADGTELNVPAWAHHLQQLHESQTMISGSVYSGLTDDPYLQDYQNVLGLLQDLLTRLALTENDLEQKIQARRSSKSIHEQAELNEEAAAASDREEDYFVSEAAALSYGSLNGRDVLGSLIQQLLRPFREMAESAEGSPAEESLRSDNGQPTAVPDERMARSLKASVHRFVKQFRKGIGSDLYLDKVTPDILVTNAVLYSHFLWKMLELQKQEAYLQPDEVWEELYDICGILCRYGERTVVYQQLVEEALIPQLLAMIVAKARQALQDEDNVSARYQRKQLAQLLTKLHRHVMPIRTGYLEMIPTVRGYLARGEVALTWHEVLNHMEELFPFYPLERLQEWLHGRMLIQKLQVKTVPSLDKPLLSVYVDTFPKGADFSLQQLLLLARMLRVEEWEEQEVFQISWLIRDKKHPLERYSLKYDRKKGRLVKFFIYRDGQKKPYPKDRVFISDILDAAETGDAEILSF